MRRELHRESVCYLLESTELWGGVKAVFDHAERLSARGWSVWIATRAGPPDWRDLSVPVVTVPNFGHENLPPASCYVGTIWSTIEPAYIAGGGACVHLCQGYDGDLVEDPQDLPQIEQAYRLPTFKIATAPHLCRLINDRFGQECRLVRYAIDSEVFHARGRPDADRRRPRVVVVGPFEFGVKGIQTALTALRLLRRSGAELEVVRISQHAQSAAERELLPADEYHEHLREQDVAEVLRTCDLVLSASTDGEGFGLPVMEAMACGCAAVLSEIPAYRGFGEAVGGWEPYAVFCPPDDAGAFAAATGRLLAHPDERAALAASAGRLARRYDAPEVEEILVTVMDEALNACLAGDDERRPVRLEHELALARRRAEDAEAHLAAWRGRKLARPLTAVDALAERLAPPGTRRRRLMRRVLACIGCG